MKTIQQLTTIIAVCLVCFAGTAQAQVNNMKEALAAALKHETIAKAGDKAKLYTAYCTVGSSSNRWTFQFYTGDKMIHTVSVDSKGKARYSSRDKGSLKLFDELDMSKLPAPADVLVDDIVDRAKAVLDKLELNPIADKKRYLNYYLRNDFRNKSNAYHHWSVTLPIGDGKKGKSVGFRDGKFDTISNSSISL